MSSTAGSLSAHASGMSPSHHDVATDARLRARWGAPHRMSRRWSFAGAGLALGASLIFGLIVLRNAYVDRAFTPEWLVGELRSHALIYGYLGVTILGVLTTVGAILGGSYDELERLSATDPLTGLANRRVFVDRLDQEIARASRYGNSLSLLFVDLDGLKQINDRHGHAAGDAVLSVVAECLRSSCRATELAARCGGDEFAILAPETSADEAVDLAARIQNKLGTTSLVDVPEDVRVTVSIGVTDLERAGTIEREAMIAAADRALYAAKAAGRNRAILAAPPRTTATRARFQLVRQRAAH